MKTLHKALAGVFAATAMASGISIGQVYRYESPPVYVQANPANTGVIESIDVVGDSNRSGNKAAGTILGGVIGGVIGHQFGSGRGNDAATVAGALGGAAVGHELAERRSGDGVSYRVNVRMDNGDRRTFYQGDIGGLAVGDRIQIDGDRVFRYSSAEPRYEPRPYRYASGDVRYEERPYRSSDARYEDRPYRIDRYGNRVYDETTYQLAQAPETRYLPSGRIDRRVYTYDSQGYRVDQFGNRYDSEGYWVDERGNRHEYQDPPMPDQPTNRINRPQ